MTEGQLDEILDLMDADGNGEIDIGYVCYLSFNMLFKFNSRNVICYKKYGAILLLYMHMANMVDIMNQLSKN